MRIFKDAIKPAKTVSVLVETLCDLCKMPLPKGDNYEVDEVTVAHRIGTHFPEGANIDATEFDICGKCFTEKLLPWLVSQGAEPRIEEGREY